MTGSATTGQGSNTVNHEGVRAEPFSSGFMAALGNGVTVELVGVCGHPSESRQWWRPDGTLLGKAPYKTMGSRLTHDEGYSDYEFVFRVEGSDSISTTVDIPGGSRGTHTGMPYDQDGGSVNDLRVYTANQPDGRDAALVRIGATGAKWQTKAKHRPTDEERSHDFESQTIVLGRAYEADGDTILPVVQNLNKPATAVAIRVVAITKDGPIRLSSMSGSGGNSLDYSTYQFKSLSLKDVERFEFQTRPYEWIVFKNVSLGPNRQTDLRIEME